VSLAKHAANLVKKVEKAGLFWAKDIKKVTIPHNSGQKKGRIEDYLLLLHLEFHL